MPVTSDPSESSALTTSSYHGRCYQGDWRTTSRNHWQLLQEENSPPHTLETISRTARNQPASRSCLRWTDRLREDKGDVVPPVHRLESTSTRRCCVFQPTGDDQLVVPVSSFQLNIFLKDLQMILFCFNVVVNDFFETLIEPRFNTTHCDPPIRPSSWLAACWL